jgi:hypothetical protein
MHHGVYHGLIEGNGQVSILVPGIRRGIITQIVNICIQFNATVSSYINAPGYAIGRSVITVAGASENTDEWE